MNFFKKIFGGANKKTSEDKIAQGKMLSNEPIVWTGDLEDDCTANWAGLMLRVEWMDEDYWWWAVSDVRTGEEVDSSNNYDTLFIGGEISRQKAESVARKYLGIK